MNEQDDQRGRIGTWTVSRLYDREEIAMQLPEGYEAYVLPRSSTFKHFGITMVNSAGRYMKAIMEILEKYKEQQCLKKYINSYPECTTG